MWCKNIAGRFFGLVTKHVCDRWTELRLPRPRQHSCVARLKMLQKDCFMQYYVETLWQSTSVSVSRQTKLSVLKTNASDSLLYACHTWILSPIWTGAPPFPSLSIHFLIFCSFFLSPFPFLICFTYFLLLFIPSPFLPEQSHSVSRL